jgi:hypothetical protein
MEDIEKNPQEVDFLARMEKVINEWDATSSGA